MMSSFSPHLDILPPAQKRLWLQLGFTPAMGFVLYGGTAVALRLGHRVSVDFDFFSERPLDKEDILKQLSRLEALVLQDQPQTLTLLISSREPEAHDVKLSFFGNIGIGRVDTPEVTDDGILQVASAIDLLATKVKVILQRIEAKDYRDVAALIQAGVSLPRGLAAARGMYGETFQPMESLKAMTWFEGGDLDTLTRQEQDILIRAAGGVRDLPAVEVVSRQLTAS